MVTRRDMRDAKRLRSRRIRAILAGGLVLGVGGAATLAAWNDSEYGAATFTSGSFDIVGSTTGTGTFTNHPVGSPAALSFTAPFSGMAPGNTVYALFSVKTSASSVKGNVQVTAGTTGGTGLAPSMTYGVKTIAGTTCDSSAYTGGTVVVADGTALTAGAASAQALLAAGGNQINYCFAVTLKSDAPNTAQGLTAIQTWILLGTST